MNNKEKYRETFIKSLAIEKEKFNENIKYSEIQEWDSIGHMTLISGLEESFSITFETDDIITLVVLKRDRKFYLKNII